MKWQTFLQLVSLAVFPIFISPALAEITAEQHYAKGLQEDTDGKYPEAIADFDAAIKMQPDYWKAYANRSAAEYNAKRYQVASNDVNTAMAHLPPMKGLTDLRAMIDRAMQPAPSAAEIQRQQAALQGLRQLAAIQAGAGTYGYGDPTFGISQLANTLAMSRRYTNQNTVPTNTPTQTQTTENNEKLALLTVGANTPQPHTPEKSVKLTALTVVPSSARKYLGQGTEKSQAGDWTGAIADFDEYIKQDPNSFEAYAKRGTAKLQTGDMQGAIVDLDKAVELMPDNPNTKDYRDNLKAAIEQAKQSLNGVH